MTSLVKVLGGRVALVGALLTFACQKDGQAVFDNDNLADATAGKAGATPGGSQGVGGGINLAGSSTGGSSAEAGTGGSGAKAGTDSGGSGQAGEMNEGGKAGTGTAGDGGSSGSGGSGGSGGTKPDPEPVTLMLDAFEDSYVDQCSSLSNFGDAERITLDADTDQGCITQSLMRVALDEIPAGALVSKATLTLRCLDPGGLIEVSYAGETWTEDGVRWSNRPEAGAAIGTMTCLEVGPVSFDLKAAVVAWLGGENNYGVYLRTETESGTDFASSEADGADNRPVLSVTYTLPVK